MSARLSTAAPAKDVVLYDGHCRICTQAARQLRPWLPDAELSSFREPGVLERFPGVTPERCERAMQLVRSDGQVFEGAEAFVQALRRRAIGKLATVYYVPGLRQLADALYRYIARRRFEIAGRTGQCDPDGTCHLHLR